jgi:hypothetical protein
MSKYMTSAEFKVSTRGKIVDNLSNLMIVELSLELKLYDEARVQS